MLQGSGCCGVRLHPFGVTADGSGASAGILLAQLRTIHGDTPYATRNNTTSHDGRRQTNLGPVSGTAREVPASPQGRPPRRLPVLSDRWYAPLNFSASRALRPTPFRALTSKTGGGAFLGLAAYGYYSGQAQLRRQEAVILKSRSVFGMRSRRMGITGISLGLAWLGLWRLFR